MKSSSRNEGVTPSPLSLPPSLPLPRYTVTYVPSIHTYNTYISNIDISKGGGGREEGEEREGVPCIILNNNKTKEVLPC